MAPDGRKDGRMAGRTDGRTDMDKPISLSLRQGIIKIENIQLMAGDVHIFLVRSLAFILPGKSFPFRKQTFPLTWTMLQKN